MSSPSPNSPPPPLADSLPPPEASSSSSPSTTPHASTSSPPPVASTSSSRPSNASSTATSPRPALTPAKPPSSTSAIATPSSSPKPNATADSPAPSMSSLPPPTPPVANAPSSVTAPSPSLVLSPRPPLTGADPPSDSAPPVSSPSPGDVDPPVSDSAPPPSSLPPPPPKHRKMAPQPQSSPSPVSPPTASNSSTAGTSVILAPAPSSNAIPPVKPPSSSSKVPSNLTPRLSVVPPPPPPKAHTASGNSRFAGIWLPIGLIIVVVAVATVIILCCFRWSKRKRNTSQYVRPDVMPSPSNSSQKSSSTLSKTPSRIPFLGRGSGSDVLSLSTPDRLGNSKSCFTYEQLEKITNGFSSENLLGEGGFGCVYKGCLLDGREVAVKQLKVGGSQGEREFRAEVETFSRIHHRHLVSLVGYCIAQNQRLLVYDYVPNNTLYFHLHDGPVMDWATRVKVAAGSARGIAYLHEDCHPRIIHRDIKSSNILLDNDFEAKVSDFGLARLALDTYTHVTTRVMGTFGYMAPEYASSGKLTEKSDVFSFGVVLLELITGCKPLAGDQSLFEWAQPFLHRILSSLNSEGRVNPSSVEELVDPRLETNYVADEMFQMIDVAASCIRRSAVSRPRMGQVSSVLDSLANNKDLLNGMSPDKSEIFQDSAYINRMRRMAFGQDSSCSYFDEEGRSQEWRQ